MTRHAKLFQGAAAVLVAATAVVFGTAVGLGSDDEPSARPAARPAAMVRVNPWAAGDAAMARCDLLPEHYVTQDESVRAGGAGGGVNVWAAGNAAVARYFNELARLCVAARPEP
jgi:hypothetical protein